MQEIYPKSKKNKCFHSLHLQYKCMSYIPYRKGNVTQTTSWDTIVTRYIRHKNPTNRYVASLFYSEETEAHLILSKVSAKLI